MKNKKSLLIALKKIIAKSKGQEYFEVLPEKQLKHIPRYKDFQVLKTIKGNYKRWELTTRNSDSKVAVVLGARGSGKTGFGLRFSENMAAMNNKKNFYTMGFENESLPNWIKDIQDVSEIKNDSFVIIDESGLTFSSKKSLSRINQLLRELLFISRHKNLSIFFILQNSSNIDLDALRQADFLVLKAPSLLQQKFERKIVKEIYEEREKDFEKFQSDLGLTFIYSNEFEGFVSNSLPSFWEEELSKAFKEK